MLLPWKPIPEKTPTGEPFDGKEYLLADHNSMTLGFWDKLPFPNSSTWSTVTPFSLPKFWRKLPDDSEIILSDPTSPEYFEKAKASSKLFLIRIKLAGGKSISSGGFIWRESEFDYDRAVWLVYGPYSIQAESINGFALIDPPPGPPLTAEPILGPTHSLWG